MTPENVAARASIQQSPKCSACHSTRDIKSEFEEDLKLHPYKIMLAQELTERDHAKRRALSVKILEQVPAAAVFLSTNYAHLHINGDINKQNFHYWAEHNPHELHE